MLALFESDMSGRAKLASNASMNIPFIHRKYTMKKTVFSVILIFAATKAAMAGPACDDIRYMCPGSMCYAQQVSCQSERELEARIQRLKEAEEATAAEKKRNVEATNEERQKREQLNLTSVNSSASPSSQSVSSSEKKATTKTLRQKSLPANAKWNVPPHQGWSCIRGFHREALVCGKDE